MTGALNRAAVRRDIENREAEAVEIAALKNAFLAIAEDFARRHSGVPEYGQQGWRATVMDYIPNFLDDLFCERERQLARDNEEDELLIGRDRP